MNHDLELSFHHLAFGKALGDVVFGVGSLEGGVSHGFTDLGQQSILLLHTSEPVRIDRRA